MEGDESAGHLICEGDAGILHPWLVIGRRISHLSTSVALLSSQVLMVFRLFG